jgi:hypothetical protein
MTPDRAQIEFRIACFETFMECPDGYAKAYAAAGTSLTDIEAIRVQSRYILNNMDCWHGSLAADCRKIFKRPAREGQH